MQSIRIMIAPKWTKRRRILGWMHSLCPLRPDQGRPVAKTMLNAFPEKNLNAVGEADSRGLEKSSNEVEQSVSRGFRRPTVRRRDWLDWAQDRKSTRLNSSH